VIYIVARGTSFAVAALAAGAAVQDDLVRSSHPVFVDEEVGGFGRGGFAITPASVAILCNFERVSRRIGRSGKR
jgi:hypothetical protein